jgi:nitroreductase
MDLYQGILTRRSIRKYTSKTVPDELVRELINAAMHAPSARNSQPWHFVVLDDRKILNQIPKVHPNAKMLEQASLGILLCGDEDLALTKEYLPLDLAAATQNLLLAVHAKGLGAVWIGIYPREARIEAMRDLLNLPSTILPVSLVSIGFPGEEAPKVDRFIEERIHKNGW